jgi:DNA topoisomerase IB
MAMYKAREYFYEKSFLSKLSQWSDEAREFAERFKCVVTFKKAINVLLEGKDIVKDKKAADAIAALFVKIKEQKSLLDKETDVTRAQLSLINDIRLAVGGSEAAEKRLMRSVSSLRDPDLNEMFLHVEDTSDEMKDVYAKLAALVKKHGNVSGYEMPVEILKQWQTHNKEKGQKLKAHEEYLELRKKCNEAYKKQLANIVRSSGQPYLPTHEVKRLLAGTLNPIPETFVGNIDDLGNYYTVAGKKMLQNPVGVVMMNPAYDPEKDDTNVCKYKAPFSADFSPAYTVDYRKGRRAAKFDVVAQTIPLLPKLTTNWLPDLQKGPGTKNGAVAVLCELIYQTSGRISSTSAKTDGKTTYGISTLQMKHVQINENRIIINYIGKAAGKQRHVLKFNTQRGQMLHDALVEFAFNKKASDYLITFRGKPLSNTTVNTYMREIGFPEKFTVHKLRTAKGTAMAAKLLSKPPFKKGEAKDADVNKWVELQCKKVGEELGHMSGEEVTANTAIANYIDPSVFAAIYEKTGTRPNAKIQKAIDSVASE